MVHIVKTDEIPRDLYARPAAVFANVQVPPELLEKLSSMIDEVLTLS